MCAISMCYRIRHDFLPFKVTIVTIIITIYTIVIPGSVVKPGIEAAIAAHTSPSLFTYCIL